MPKTKTFVLEHCNKIDEFRVANKTAEIHSLTRRPTSSSLEAVKGDFESVEFLAGRAYTFLYGTVYSDPNVSGYYSN